MKNIIFIIFAIIINLCFSKFSYADIWPNNKIIKIIVPNTPGSGIDIAARKFASILEKQINNPVIIENKSGAAQQIAAQHLLTLPADGTAILFGSTSLISASIIKESSRSFSFDIEKDFAFIFLVGSIKVNQIVSNKYFNEIRFLDYLKSKKEALYCHIGYGSFSHTLGEKYIQNNNLIGIPIPYKGTLECITDLLSDRVDYFFSSPLGVQALLEEKKLNGFYGKEFDWYGLIVSSNVKDSVIKEIEDVVKKVVESDDWKNFNLLDKENIKNSKEFEKFLKNQILEFKEISKNLK